MLHLTFGEIDNFERSNYPNLSRLFIPSQIFVRFHFEWTID